MKMQKRLILLLLVILAVSLTVGCTAGPTETTPPTQINTEPPTDPPMEPATGVSADRLSEYQALFGWDGDIIYSQATGYEYTRAADVDLYYLFYLGVNYDGSWGSIPASDRDLLVGAGFMTEMDIQIMPAALLEEKLQQYFGVGLAEVQIPDEWAYSAETDTYYSNHNDAYSHVVEVTGYEDLPDGTVLLHLIVDAAHDHDMEEWYWEAPMDMTLRPVEDGWQIVSNVFAE